MVRSILHVAPMCSSSSISEALLQLLVIKELLESFDAIAALCFPYLLRVRIVAAICSEVRVAFPHMIVRTSRSL